MQGRILVRFLIATLCQSAHASCADWGFYAVRVAAMRNGGLTQGAAEEQMWNDSLASALDGASNPTRFDGFNPDRAKEVIKAVYGSHHAPSYYGVVTTELCHTSSWTK
ncbi:hypothetical protein C8K18_10724 [Paraburkholderia sp. GV068]|uniref:hypothetical protein n=1 Tax=unclassified Paraburkholderia TaxID=2615204 RepID=UPI000D444F4C|nr:MULTISPECIES: hypothetical protein [unclassified Paraburkholderia]PTQ98442.1 hypothetical protein C8K19_10724 [Paraburkholderia sp. GV072]PUB03685.1 hypothetical protein C8K18_10724 [Paraburkholderia sp. GV068]